MRQTTVLIRSTIEENSRVRVYWRWAVPSKSWSRARGFRAFSRVARTMTLTGASRANCSKTSPRSMGVASPESGYLQVQRQVSRNIGPPTQGWGRGLRLGHHRGPALRELPHRRSLAEAVPGRGNRGADREETRPSLSFLGRLSR